MIRFTPGFKPEKRKSTRCPPGPEKGAARQQYLADLSQTQATLRADLEYKARMQMYQAQTQAARAYQNPPPPGYHYEAGGTTLFTDPLTRPALFVSGVGDEETPVAVVAAEPPRPTQGFSLDSRENRDKNARGSQIFRSLLLRPCPF